MTRSVLLASFAVLTQACGPDMYVMMEFEERPEGGAWVYMGGSCSGLDSGGSSGSGLEGADGGYSIDVTDSGLAIRVFDSERALVEEHAYGRDVLESGQKERVSFTIGDYDHRITFWGGPDCISPREPDQDAVERAFPPRDAGTPTDAGR